MFTGISYRVMIRRAIARLKTRLNMNIFLQVCGFPLKKNKTASRPL